jgi:hypothetical protein
MQNYELESSELFLDNEKVVNDGTLTSLELATLYSLFDKWVNLPTRFKRRAHMQLAAMDISKKLWEEVRELGV